MKPVEIEILLKDRLTPGLVKSESEIKDLFSAVQRALSSTEGRAGHLREAFGLVKGAVSDYSQALGNAEKSAKAYKDAGNEEAYEKECVKVRELEKELSVLTSMKIDVGAALAKETRELETNAAKTDALSESAKNLSGQTKELADSGEEYSSTLVKLLGGQESYNAILGALPPEIRSVITGIEGMTNASLAFIATPLGMTLAALATALALLNTYWHASADGEREFAEISGYTEGVVKSLKDECVDLGRKLSGLWKNPLQAVREYWKGVLSDFKDGFTSLGGSAKAFGRILSSAMTGDLDGVKAAWEDMVKKLGEGTKKLWKANPYVNLMKKSGLGVIGTSMWDLSMNKIPEWNKKAKNDAAISSGRYAIEEQKVGLMEREVEIDRELVKLQNEMYSGTPEERLEARAKAQELVNEKYDKQIELAKESAKLAQQDYDNHESNLEDARKLAEAKAEVLRLEVAKEREMLSFNRRAASAEHQLAHQGGAGNSQGAGSSPVKAVGVAGLDWEEIFATAEVRGRAAAARLGEQLEGELSKSVDAASELSREAMIRLAAELGGKKGLLDRLFPQVAEKKAWGEKAGLGDYLGIVDAGNPLEWVAVANENAQGLADLVDTLGLGTTEFGEGVHSFADGCASFNNVVSDLMSGNVFGAVNDTLKGLDSWGNIFNSGGGANKNYERDMERLSAANERLTDAIDRLAKRMEGGGYLEVEKSYEEQKKYFAEKEANTAKKLDESIYDWHKENWRGKGHVDSSETVLWKKLTAEEWEKIGRSIGKTGKQAKDDTLRGLSVEQWKAIRDGEENGFLWERILELMGRGYRGEEAVSALKEYVALADEREALEDAYVTNLTGVSFDSMRDSFRSTLLDMEDDAKDTGEYISKVMAESLVDNMLSEEYEGELMKWRTNLGEALKMENKKAREDSLNALKAEYQQLMDRAKAEAAAYYEATGYDKTSTTQQSGHAGAFTAMSQDQGTKLEGLFVSGQMHWSSMDERLADVSAQLGDAGDALRRIEENTGSSAKSTAGILEELKKMVRDGLKVK